MPYFVHLHTHSDYSLLDGACSISQLVDKAYQFDMPALALTDHGNIFGAVEFYQKASNKGIKPIIGCEVYVAPQSRFKKRKTRGENIAYHLILLCKNKKGYQNLMELVSRGFTEGFYYHPRVDKKLLFELREGIIVLSGCIKGEIPSLLVKGEVEKAYQVAREFKEVYGDDFYLEIQSTGLEEQKIVNAKLKEISKELSIPLVATNDVHYIKKEDARAQEVLICIQTGKTLEDTSRLKFSSSEFYFCSLQEMLDKFKDERDAVYLSEDIAKKCNFVLERGKIYLPVYRSPDGTDLVDYLSKLCQEGLKKRYSSVSKEVMDRLKYELDIISSMGYAGYFLIVWDFIRYARENGILVGPGRGSATGSLVAYLLGITEIDPLRYGLIFERFLNPERKTLPDIDIDIQDNRRAEIIDYVRKKYGEENVAQIITFGTMAARAAVRDVGRVLGMPYTVVDRIAKLIPPNTKLRTAIERNEELKDLIKNNEEVRSLFEIAQRIEGLTRHASTHAAGVVIAPEKLTFYTPLYKTNKDEITTQYEMHSLESIGLLKMDFLGLKTLNVIKETLELVKKYEEKEIELKNIPLDNLATYRMLSRGETVGVFQLESRGMQDLLKRLKPEKFEDVIAVLALYRPGPLQSGMVDDFINRKNGKSKVEYLHPKLKPILEETYGVILYQEQVMKIANELAGFTLGEADILRRAMGKKIPQLMEEQRAKFIQGALERGVDRKTAERIFDLMAHFSGYGFNKSHSTGYALVSYQTAFLKANYPLEFMAALLTSEKDNTDKLTYYISECQRMGIKVLPPDINQSWDNFTVVEDKVSSSHTASSRGRKYKGEIRFGLTAIKNVGEAAISSILKEREEKGEFKSIFDFCRRVDLRVVNKKVLESLVKCGAFDSLPGYRSQKLAVIDKAVEKAVKINRDREKGQLSLFGEAEEKEEITLPSVKDISRSTRLNWEKELLGIYLSGHPLDGYQKRIIGCSTHSVAELRQLEDGRQVRIAGVINAISLKRDRRGKPMAFFTLEDPESEIEIVVFAKVYENFSSFVKEGELVIVEGRIDATSDPPKVVANKISLFSAIEKKGGEFHIKIGPENWKKAKLERLKIVLKKNKGRNPVYLHFQGNNGENVVIRSKSLKVEFSEEIISRIEEVVGERCCWIS
ncbi:DNA polymerase III subunit alpha [Candidatus Aerophobetes bacterium]|nr:DNA polymerase III subunit alpha [Candidatus Aerophobetes bacterium]